MAVPPDADMQRAIEAIDRGQAGIALVVDLEGKLVGTITDGDVRRGLLRGCTLQSPVSTILHSDPVIAPDGTSSEVLLGLMQDRLVRQIPLLDAERRVRDLVMLTDLIPAKSLPNRVLLMAGGAGRRLAPLTDATPKPLLVVGDQPLIDTILEQIQRHGFTRVLLAVSFMADRIRAHCGDGSKWGLDIEYLYEEEPLGTAGAVRMAGPLVAEPFLVMNCDLLQTVDLSHLLRYHVEGSFDATVAVAQYDVQVPYGTVDLSDDHVRAIQEKPAIKLFINAGMYVLEPKIAELVPDGTPFDMPDLINAALTAEMSVGSFAIREYWLDIGRPPDYERAGLDYEAHFRHGPAQS